MFGFGGTGRRRQNTAALARELPGVMAALHPVEKATVLVLANSMLRIADAEAGVPLAADPVAAGADVADRVLRGLTAHRDRLAAIAADDAAPNRRHANVHLRAAELACLTVGVGVDASFRRGCSSAWRAAWEGRTRLKEAVAWIRRYESGTGVPAVSLPRKGGPTDPDLVTIGSSVPRFLKARRA